MHTHKISLTLFQLHMVIIGYVLLLSAGDCIVVLRDPKGLSHYV